MSYSNFLRRAWLLLIFASLSTALLAQTPTDTLPPLPTDANQFVKDAIKHQLDADAADHTHWRYHIHREDEKGSQDRDVIDTKEGQIARTLLINGKPLTAEQRSNDELRMKKLVEDPAERAKRDKRAWPSPQDLPPAFSCAAHRSSAAQQ